MLGGSLRATRNTDLGIGSSEGKPALRARRTIGSQTVLEDVVWGYDRSLQPSGFAELSVEELNRPV